MTTEEAAAPLSKPRGRGHDEHDRHSSTVRRTEDTSASDARPLAEAGQTYDDGRDLVDGPRPAVEWVRRLPRKWTTARERLVLMLLACDTFDRVPPFTCSPKLDQLSEWSGEYKGQVSESIASLASPGREGRPPLLEVTRGSGRARSEYRLRTEHGPRLWSGEPDHNGLSTGHASGPAGPTTTELLWSGEPDHNLWSGEPDHNGRSGLRSGLASGPGSPTTPLPYPQDIPPSVVTDPQLGAGEVGGRQDTGVQDTLEQLARFAGHPVASCLEAVRDQLARGWLPGQIVEQVKRAGDLQGSRHPAAVLRARVEQLGTPPPALPAKCDACDPNRMVEADDGRLMRCPTCYPKRGTP